MLKIEKIEIKESKFDINLKFYFFLKYLVKTALSDKQGDDFLQIFYLYKKSGFNLVIEKFINYIDTKIKLKSKKYNLIYETLMKINCELDLELFIFSLQLYLIKDGLLAEAKMKNLLDTTKLQNLNPLSLEYDNITHYKPYSTRVNGALLSLIFFDKLENGETNLISKVAEDFVKNLSDFSTKLKISGVEANQIFMLMFNETMNQSIISDSGSNYEDRILSVLTGIGIDKDKISKTHDKNDSSTEFDFFFELENKVYGISAKRTLRERYKQFIKTAHMSKVDVMIEITLGLDLNEEKAKSIINHGVYLFVSDEVYKSRKFLQNMDGVYSVTSLNLKTLKQL